MKIFHHATSPVRHKEIRSWLTVSLLMLGAALNAPLPAGSLFVSGHDSEFHAAFGPDASGAQDLINRALEFARDGNVAPILFLQTDTSNLSLGDHTDSRTGLVASGYSFGTTPGNHFVAVTAMQFLTTDLSLYSAIFIPSHHGGTLTGSDLLALNSRSADILDYLNEGGGLVAFAEDGFRTGPPANNF